MAFTAFPSAANIRAVINGIPVGALRSFSERCVQELQLLRELGSSDNLICNPVGKQFIVDLQYILPLGCNTVDAPADPVSLATFNLVINLPNRTLRFIDCVYESVQTSCEVGGDIICTMRIIARNRLCDNETG